MSNVRTVVMMIVVAGTLWPARAQAGQGRPVELGVGTGGVLSWLDGATAPGADLRVSLPFTDRTDIEPLIALRFTRQDGRVEGFYGAHMRRRIGMHRDDATFQPYATFGLIGLFMHTRESFGSSHAVVSPPFLMLVGGGVQHPVNGRLAVRVEAQAVTFLFMPLGMRVATGVSVATGHR